MKVLIIGAGGHGQVVADILWSMARTGSQDIQVVGFVDDNAGLHKKQVLGLPVIGAVKDHLTIPHDAAILGIGNNPLRTAIFKKLRFQGEQFVSAIHPAAVVASQVKVGLGSVICAGAVVNVGTVVGQNVILNTGCTVDHHNRLADHVHIAPGAHLGGDVTVDEGALVGIGAVVMPQNHIGAFSVVGAGAVVLKPVAAHTVVAGNPARPLQKTPDTS